MFRLKTLAQRAAVAPRVFACEYTVPNPPSPCLNVRPTFVFFAHGFIFNFKSAFLTCSRLFCRYLPRFEAARFLSTPATTAPPLANSSRYEDQPVPGHLIFTHEDDTTEVVTAHMEMTLEWLVDSPPELHLFDEPPIIKETTECYTGPRD